MAEEETIRITFELERADNPPLFDELMRFAKGTKRVNRLRTLAHEGLLKQGTAARSIAILRNQESTVEEPAEQIAMTEASHELFGPSIED